jgi:hypothetical protein
MNALQATTARLEAWREHLRANPRLAALFMLLPFVLLLHLTLITRDATAEAREEAVPLQKRAARLEALAASGDWAASIREAEAKAVQWRADTWRAESAELVAADLQTVLRATGARHLAWNRMKLSPAERLAPIGGWRVRAELTGKLGEGGVLPLLQEIAEHRPRILVDQLQVSSLRGQTVTLQLSVLAIPEDGR